MTTDSKRLKGLGGMTKEEYQEAIRLLPDVPGNLARRSVTRRAEDLHVLTQMSIEELRWRQEFIKEQRNRYIECLKRLLNNPNPSATESISRALSDLDEMETDVIQAINIVAFPDVKTS